MLKFTVKSKRMNLIKKGNLLEYTDGMILLVTSDSVNENNKFSGVVLFQGGDESRSAGYYTEELNEDSPCKFKKFDGKLILTQYKDDEDCDDCDDCDD